MSNSDQLDLIIIGGGIGGVICLKYAKAAGLKAILLERKDGVGGIWRDLPAWQDIQFRKEDWALGDVPISSEKQEGILGNIQAWVDQFDLTPSIRFSSNVSSARATENGWTISAGEQIYHSRFLVAATGGFNRAYIPQTERMQSTIREYHSSALVNPADTEGRDVVVVGGGASAYDLLELCIQNNARKIVWVYRSLKWMRPTRQKKYFGTDMRFLAKLQMLGTPTRKINRMINADMRARYAKAGIADIAPESDFDLNRDQLIPGRREMIKNFANIERHRGEIQKIANHTVQFSDAQECDADLILWGTGYDLDLSYFESQDLSRITRLDKLGQRCGSLFLSLDAPNLFFLAPGVLDSSTSTPWAYAHVCKSIVSHICGDTVFDKTPVHGHVNHFDLAKFLAHRDRSNYVPGIWYLKYLYKALWHPKNRPMPIP